MKPLQNLSYLIADQANYVEDLLKQYLKDPSSVDETWRYFFDGLQLGVESSSVVSNGNARASSSSNGASTQKDLDLSAEAKVADLINAYRDRGRLLANVDPLSDPPASHPLLEISYFELSKNDLTREFTAGNFINIGRAPLQKIIARLRQVYCDTVGVEYTHIQDPIIYNWVQEHFESDQYHVRPDAKTQKYILNRLTESEIFEQFLHTRYVAQKRFSLEGGESLIPALDQIIDTSILNGAESFVVGMAHRGRLNVLVNIFGKKPEFVFTEFEQNYVEDSSMGEGDVKYHKGFSADRVFHGKQIHLTLAHNPSHLEFVNPVVEGMVRAKQRQINDKQREKVIPILIHGDAAFAGQGVVYETLNLSMLPGYSTGGTIHIVLDNQIGFTTNPSDSRSTTYSTDLAKMLEVPIFHVNGDDPEALWNVSRLASEFRQKFKKDVVVHIICYRKYGHNESDEPAFTQPLMYKKIKSHPTTRKIYADRLIKENVISTVEAEQLIDEVMKNLTQAQTLTRSENPRPFISAYESKWKGFRAATEVDHFVPIETGLSEEKLVNYGKKIVEIPSHFNIHSKLKKLFESRAKTLESKNNIDWALAEQLAYASLLDEGHVIRLSGQDVERGTFSHRHAVLNDTETGEKFTPLNFISKSQAEFTIYNSHLSEAGVLGFDYGWSLADPSALVIWEAQFGDFANGAQVIIDQFISCSEYKWHRSSGIVLFLPHGYEGQGPEHSSARIERFLQLCAKNNLAVCNFTSPAQIFHVLRRQMKRDFRKPLVVMTPKSLLRHPKMVCSLNDLVAGEFQPVLGDPVVRNEEQKEKVERILICSGKIYFDLLAAREEKKCEESVAFIRLEQFYPFPGDDLRDEILQYSNVKEVFWVQEEPRNMGVWTFLFSIWSGGFKKPFRERVNNLEISYIGRDTAAAPAVGSFKQHVRDQEQIIEEAFSNLSTSLK